MLSPEARLEETKSTKTLGNSTNGTEDINESSLHPGSGSDH